MRGRAVPKSSFHDSLSSKLECDLSISCAPPIFILMADLNPGFSNSSSPFSFIFSARDSSFVNCIFRLYPLPKVQRGTPRLFHEVRRTTNCRFVDPARWMVSVTAPAVKPLMFSTTCDSDSPRVVTPLICRITSPARRPAFSAGEPATTCAIAGNVVGEAEIIKAPMPPVK